MADLIRKLTVPCSMVKLRIKAHKLKDRDVFSKSDPICVVYKHLGNTGWREVGRTECLQNCLSPEWAKCVELEYFFEQKQPIKFEIFDIDNKSTDLSSQDFLGRIECDLAEIISLGTFNKKLAGLKGDCGSITITSEEVEDGSRELILFETRAVKVDKKDFFGKSDPYLNIYRMNTDGSRTLIHRTEFIKRTLNPTWKPFEITVRSLCAGDKTRDIFIECWDNDDDIASKHDFIGSCQVSVNKLLGETTELKLINPKKQAKKKKYVDSGKLHIRTKVIQQPTFLDFITGGTQLDFSVAIDFTASNGQVNLPSSLHYVSAQRANQYEVAIRSVLEICQYYNNSKIFDCFGFGAIVPPSTTVLPLFDLSWPQQILNNPSVVGVNGVLTSYRKCLDRVKLYGPTNFAPIIEEVAKRTVAKTRTSGARYQILLIITDGAISDLHRTKKAIIEACHLPLSIIIIGVGDANFDAMDELDGDNVRISVDGRYAERDIVQFVPIRDFAQKGNISPDELMCLLAKEVLAEVPAQLLSYMKSRNISPRPADDPFPRDSSAELQSCGYTTTPSGSVSQVAVPPYPMDSAYQQAPPYPTLNNVAIDQQYNQQSAQFSRHSYPSAPPLR